MIRLADIVLSFPDGGHRVTAVDHVTLDARPGTVTGITGPSGSGKSSLLAVAATLIRPDSGSVVIDGITTADLSAREMTALRRATIGIVFQQSNLVPSLTAQEQLEVMSELGGRHRPGRRAAAARRARELLDAVGLADQARNRPHQLSGGQRQRVNIARALMNGPRVLVVDEPTSALDQERGARIIELILDLTREQDTSTLLVTHDRKHLPQMHDVITLVDGAVIARSSPVAPNGG